MVNGLAVRYLHKPQEVNACREGRVFPNVSVREVLDIFRLNFNNREFY
jgi:hypothetical protein